ncbi:N-6 DNA methylase [Deinococcus sp. YIM 77859]|uniref:class I SAM-dependent DNA methyltransferase n=1 Tax=Deinococcus sp. YIM 77859 TaxID=1540221 RepID=UPI0005543072|nr:N-6 DNA methylase [Deinococcus sp. YIM 77859]
MTQRTTDIVQKLWNLCNDLRDDGVTYHQYVTELTYLLFLKMAKETGQESQLPDGYRWDDLRAKTPPERLPFYRHLLVHLGGHGSKLVQAIFANAASFIKKPATLSKLVEDIHALDWYSAKEEGLGDLYEGLLEKNATEKKSGAGQYFTPRPLIDAIVRVMKPTSDDVIQDPAAGTGGFLIAAHHYIDTHEDVWDMPQEKQQKYLHGTFYGMELVQDTHRLALMNLMLHGLASDPDSSGIRYGDTLSPEGQTLPKATLILSNPPFGTKKGSGETRTSREDFTYPTNNKQLAFLQHIYRALNPGGRAAVVLPDNVLFESGAGRQIRADLMDKCRLHTILRLPTGIFYAQGVKTNVLFFTKVSDSAKGSTEEVWVYDLRANMPAFGKRTPLTPAHFDAFVQAFGDDPQGGPEALAKRTDTGEEGRFRRFTREQIRERNDSLDISWLKDDSEGSGELPEPAQLAEEALTELKGAMEELKAILLELGESEEELEEAGVLA